MSTSFAPGDRGPDSARAERGTRSPETFLESVRRARAYLEEQRRVSRRALRFEFDLDDEQIEALVRSRIGS